MTCRQSRSKTAGTLARARLRVCFLLHYINPKHESIMGLGVMSWLKVAEFICNIDWVLVEVAQLRSQSARGQDFSVLFLLQKSAGILEDALSPKSSDSAVELSDQLWSSESEFLVFGLCSGLVSKRRVLQASRKRTGLRARHSSTISLSLSLSLFVFCISPRFRLERCLGTWSATEVVEIDGRGSLANFANGATPGRARRSIGDWLGILASAT